MFEELWFSANSIDLLGYGNYVGDKVDEFYHLIHIEYYVLYLR